MYMAFPAYIGWLLVAALIISSIGFYKYRFSVICPVSPGSVILIPVNIRPKIFCHKSERNI